MLSAKVFRHHLHAHPELSGKEQNTSEYVVLNLKKLGIQKIHEGFSMYSVLAEIDGLENGPTILFRCELDALPIYEENVLTYRSTIDGVAHLCGHDGHAATMFRLAQKLVENPVKNGKVLLFFQSAEEIGAGANATIESGILSQFSIDYVFAFHNFPGFKLGDIIIKNGLFTPCVESGIFELTGKTSHAAEPSKGINPALAIAEIVNFFDALNFGNKASDNFFVATPIHIEMGEKAFGTSAGQATVAYTFRAWKNEYFDLKKKNIEDEVLKICQKYQLALKINWVETFNANNNNEDACLQINKAAKTLNYNVFELESPFEFGEDFGFFTMNYKGAMFGIGSGLEKAPLHNAHFDFPDELIEIGAEMFNQITQQIMDIK